MAFPNITVWDSGDTCRGKQVLFPVEQHLPTRCRTALLNPSRCRLSAKNRVPGTKSGEQVLSPVGSIFPRDILDPPGITSPIIALRRRLWPASLHDSTIFNPHGKQTSRSFQSLILAAQHFSNETLNFLGIILPRHTPRFLDTTFPRLIHLLATISPQLAPGSLDTTSPRTSVPTLGVVSPGLQSSIFSSLGKHTSRGCQALILAVQHLP